MVAVVAFVPQLLTHPGLVSSDTKSYLYLDPGRYLRQSASVWDPSTGLGTMTHQQIGYLFPMGPFYWAVHALGIPTWVGQRMWMGGLIFFAGAGVLYLSRTLGLADPGRSVAAAAYMFSPYFLQYAGRISDLLMPWSGLPWLLAFTIASTRTRGWRYPALFALVWLTVSGSNASGALYAAVACALWLPYAVLAAKEATWRGVWSAVWRIAVLTAAVSLWWFVELAAEGHYGLNVLDYTETVAVVAQTSLASEVLRGLGSWFFYGSDNLGQWASTSIGFTREVWLVVMTFMVPVLALAGAAVVRWRMRAYFVIAFLVAMVLAVGAHPYTVPSKVGALLKSFMAPHSIGLAFRSTDRATPILVLSLAMLLGAAITALARRARPTGVAAGALAIAVVAVANPAVWNGTTVLADRYAQTDPVPAYLTQAATSLDGRHGGTRVLALPATYFGIGSPYRWGDTTDPVWPGLLSRSFVTPGQVPLGSLAGFDLLYGLDDPIQTRTADPVAIAPLARLMSVGDVVLQNDLVYELYAQPQPRELQQLVTPLPKGLTSPVGYGPPTPQVSLIPKVDQAALVALAGTTSPSPIEAYTVTDPRPVVRAEPTSGAVVVDGDGVGLNEAAAAGLLDTNASVVYAGTLDTNTRARAAALSGASAVVVTDSNRKQAFQFNVVGRPGQTLTAGAPQPSNPVALFGAPPPGSQSTAQIPGVASYASAPSEQNPLLALDGLPETAWTTNPGAPTTGRWWQVTLTDSVTTDEVHISQPVPSGYQFDQWITRATLTFDGGSPIRVDLGHASRTAAGQTITFPQRTFSTLRVTIDATNLKGANRHVLAAASPAGLAEVRVGRVQTQQVINMPSDLLGPANGPSLASHRVVLVMTRQRVVPIPPLTDREPVLARAFTLPAARTFTVSGTARLAPNVVNPLADAVVGRTPASAGGVTVTSSSRLSAEPSAGASAALDGDPSTVWSPDFGAPAQDNAWISATASHAVTVDHLNLQVVADGSHSVPTALRIDACAKPDASGRCPATGSQSESVRLPSIADARVAHSVTAVPVTFPSVQGSTITVTFTGVRAELTRNFQTREPITFPLGIAELGIPGVQVSALPATLPPTCRTDLLTVDGRPLPVEVAGTPGAALDRRGLSFHTCGPDAGGVTLGAGRHVVQSSDGMRTALDVDQLTLDSAPSAPSAPTAAGIGSPEAPTVGAPQVHVTAATATTIQMRVTGATTPFWLVLGENRNAGWQATIAGRPGDLGPSTLVDGFANGWMVDPGGAHTPPAHTLSVTLRFTPQRDVDVALVVSAVAAVGCLAIVLGPLRRSRRRGRRDNVPDSTASVAARAVGSTARRATDDALPTLVNPFALPASVPAVPLALVAALAAGLVGAAVAPKAVMGLGLGLVVLVGLLVPRARGVIGLGAAAVVLFTVGYIAIAQATQHYAAAAWTNHFERANTLVWAAVLLVGGELVVELLQRAPVSGPDGPPPPPPAPPGSSRRSPPT